MLSWRNAKNVGVQAGFPLRLGWRGRAGYYILIILLFRDNMDMNMPVRVTCIGLSESQRAAKYDIKRVPIFMYFNLGGRHVAITGCLCVVPCTTNFIE